MHFPFPEPATSSHHASTSQSSALPQPHSAQQQRLHAVCTNSSGDEHALQQLAAHAATWRLSTSARTMPATNSTGAGRAATCAPWALVLGGRPPAPLCPRDTNQG